MNNYLFIDAVSYLDADLLASHLERKDKLRNKLKSKRKVNILRWSAVAACFMIMAIGVVKLSIAFLGNQSTDIYRQGDYYASNIDEITELYGENWLVANLDILSDENVPVDLYYNVGGESKNPDDWYSLTLGRAIADSRFSIYSLFDKNKSLEDWKIDNVFTKEATTTEVINGVTVYYAEGDLSVDYTHKILAIFDYDGVVYDVRVDCNDPQIAHDIVQDMLDEIK